MPRRVWFKKRPNNGRRASDDDDDIKKKKLKLYAIKWAVLLLCSYNYKTNFAYL